MTDPDGTERYRVQMVPHSPEMTAPSEPATDEVIQRHSKRIIELAGESLGLKTGYDWAVQQISVAQSAIDALQDKNVTINIDGAGMFERFTDRARRVVVLAQEEARTLNHNYIGTEHFLLGLVHEGEGVAALALTASGVDLEECRKRVEDLVAAGTDAPSGHIPFTPRGKKVMEMALREALQLGHNFIGTEHLLLGLIREAEGVGAQVLKAMGCELNAVRQQVLHIVGENPRTETARPVRSGPQFAAPPTLDATVLKGLRVYVDAIDAQLKAAGY